MGLSVDFSVDLSEAHRRQPTSPLPLPIIFEPLWAVDLQINGPCGPNSIGVQILNSSRAGPVIKNYENANLSEKLKSQGNINLDHDHANLDRSQEGKKTRTRWTPEEDEILWKYINEHGKGCWPTVAMNLGLSRCSNSCRRRWVEHLHPDVKLDQITQDEEDLIIQLRCVEGKRWSEIAQHLPGRSYNAIKNHWNTHLSKKLKSLGEDPITHQPLNQPDSSAHHDHANLDRSQAAEMVDLHNLDPNIWNHCIEHYPMGCGAENCQNFLCFQQK